MQLQLIHSDAEWSGRWPEEEKRQEDAQLYSNLISKPTWMHTETSFSPPSSTLKEFSGGERCPGCRLSGLPQPKRPGWTEIRSSSSNSIRRSSITLFEITSLRSHFYIYTHQLSTHGLFHQVRIHRFIIIDLFLFFSFRELCICNRWIKRRRDPVRKAEILVLKGCCVDLILEEGASLLYGLHIPLM